jgi:hypothetical protein
VTVVRLYQLGGGGMSKSTDHGQAKTVRYWLLLAALPLASGAALIIHVLTTISLGVALIGAGIIVSGAGILAWMRLPSIARTEIVRRAKVGLMAGFLATVAYDVSRWLIVTVFHDTFAPFHVFPIFGYAIGSHPYFKLKIPCTAPGIAYGAYLDTGEDRCSDDYPGSHRIRVDAFCSLVDTCLLGLD